MHQNFHKYIELLVDNPDADIATIDKLCDEQFEITIKEGRPDQLRRGTIYDFVAVYHGATKGSKTEHAATAVIYTDYLKALFKISIDRLYQWCGEHPFDMDSLSKQAVLFARGHDRMAVRTTTAGELVSNIAVENFLRALNGNSSAYEHYLREPLNYIVFGVSFTVDYDAASRPAFTFVLDIAGYRFLDEARQAAEFVQEFDNYAARPAWHLPEAEVVKWTNANES